MTLLKYLFSLVPTRLPVGIQEFNDWASSIRELVGPGFEQVPEDDFKFVLANNIIHLGPQRCYVPKNYFVRTIHKGAANQIASQIFQDVKARHEATVKAAQKPAEVTAQPAGASDGQEKVPANH